MAKVVESRYQREAIFIGDTQGACYIVLAVVQYMEANAVQTL